MHTRSAATLFIAIASLLAGVVSLLSIWGIVGPYLWWQSLLSLAVVMVTMWVTLGALRYGANEANSGWMSYEATMALVGIFFLLIVSAVGSAAIGTDVQSYETGINATLQ